MVDFAVSDEQEELRRSVRRFLADKSPSTEVRRLMATDEGYDPAVWTQMAEQLGLPGLAIPEEYGGSGYSYVELAVVFEEAGAALACSPLFATVGLAANALLSSGDDAAMKEYLPQIAAGERLFALAADEAPRHAPTHIATRAEASGNGFRLNGTKGFVLDGAAADTLIVAARTDGADDAADGITLFLVDAKAAGVSVARRSMVDSRGCARVTLADVQVDGADVLGAVGGGWPLLERVLDTGRAALAAEMLGVAHESFRRTVDYLKEREQFGAKIGSFQALQHRAAHLFCEVELARSATLRALVALDADEERVPLFASLAKAKAGEVAKLATNEGVQMHGGIGMTDDFDIGFFMKRARAARETFGDFAFHGDRLAGLMGY